MSTARGTCPVCKKTLLPTDDVVTCPECGACYHRACYEKEGHCIFEDKHSDHFEYNDETKSEVPPGFVPPINNQRITCPKCGTLNDSRNIFCERCGASLHQAAPLPNQGPFGTGPRAGQQGSPFYGMPNAMNVTLDGTIDDIPVVDWATYIGKSSEVYVGRMKQQDLRKSKTSFSFSAFFLTPFYFAYRKMWGWAIFSFLLSLLTSVPNFLGILYMQNSPLVAGLSETLLFNLSSVASLISFFSSILFGIFAVFLYRRSSAKKIKKLRQSYKQDSEYQTALAKHGGVSILGVVIFAVALFIISGFIMQYSGIDWYSYYNFV